MEQYKTEVIVHSMDGSTLTLKSVMSKTELSQCFFGTNGFNSLVGFMSSDDSYSVVNMNNVCLIVLNDLGGEDGDKGVD